jgi:hypothetical protein
MFIEIIVASYGTKPIYTRREQSTKFVTINQWHKIISTTSHSSVSGIVLYRTVSYCILYPLFFY